MWQCEMTLLLRALINDLVEPYKYSNAKLEQIILASAKIIQPTLDFDVDYEINLVSSSISPDPVEQRDDSFSVLVSLKAACLIMQGETKLATNTSIRIQDASAIIDVTNQYKSKMDLWKKLCDDYDRARLNYVMGSVKNFKAVLTPYTVPTNLKGYYFG